MNDTYEKDEKLTTNSKPSIDEDVLDKAYLDEMLSKKEGHISYTEKDYNEIILVSIKQSLEEILIRRAVKTHTQKLSD